MHIRMLRLTLPKTKTGNNNNGNNNVSSLYTHTSTYYVVVIVSLLLQFSTQRIFAFVKRISTLCLSIGAPAASGLLGALRSFIQARPNGSGV